VRRGVLEFIHRLTRFPDRRGLPHHQRPAPGGNGPGPPGHRLAPSQPQLDSLRRDRYRELTGFDRFRRLMAGLERAVALGFAPIKINCVVFKDLNDDELWTSPSDPRPPLPGALHRIHAHGGSGALASPFLPMSEIPPALGGAGPPGRHHLPRHRRPRPDLQGPRVPGRVGLHQLRQRHHCPTCNRCASRRPVGCGRVSLPRRNWISRAAAAGRLRRSPGQLFREAIRLKGCVFPRPTLPSPWPPRPWSASAVDPGCGYP